MSKKWCEENDAAQVAEFKTAKENYATRHANGTGPFMLKNREPQVKTLMGPFPNWWDKRVDNVTEANFTVIKSDATRIASLLSGELDMFYPLPIQDVNRVKKTPGFRAILIALLVDGISRGIMNVNESEAIAIYVVIFSIGISLL